MLFCMITSVKPTESRFNTEQICYILNHERRKLYAAKISQFTVFECLHVQDHITRNHNIGHHTVKDFLYINGFMLNV